MPNHEHIIHNEAKILVQKLKQLGVELKENSSEKIAKEIWKLKN